MVKISFPDGSAKEFDNGVTGLEIAKSISSSLAKKALAVVVNGQLEDLNRAIEEDAELKIVTESDEEALPLMRHSSAHLMAQAIRRLFPNMHFGVGPAIDSGFYYDTDNGEGDQISEEDFPAIEKEMKKIVKENLPIERKVMSRQEALDFFSYDPYKVELITDLPEDEVITAYTQGEFTDLCRGPHVPSTGKIKVFKLLSVAGAYWRGNSDNQMMQRIYGTAFFNQADLDHFLKMREEAKERDHRKLGKELDLFMFSDEAPGMPFYLENGLIIRNELQKFLRELQAKYEYKEVQTPLIMNQRLWEQSGHWDHYKDNMYFTKVGDEDYALKPMNCPGHCLIFKDRKRSYRDLPIRMAEFGQVHRHEFSGALNGLLRVRTFCQDDAHIFVRRDQIEQEIALALKVIDEVYKIFGFEYSVELSTRPDDFMGEIELWDEAEAS
ncbi:MAG: threonine--tRNA ligase, partial [Enterococcus sp.]|nr:threonine--tRNA ligase [Enterococcus sp.]